MNALVLITEDILPLTKEDSVMEALRRMEEYKVSHFPVVDNNVFVGVVSEKDLYSLSDFHQPLRQEMLHFEEFYVHAHQLFLDVLAVAGNKKASLVPVLDEEKRYLGSVTATDLLGFLSGSLSATGPGGFIVLQVQENDYSLTEIANIVESNNAKVLNTFLLTDAVNRRLQVVLKVSALNISAILKTFERYDYQVEASYGEDRELEDLKDNYDSLMNYLKL